MSWSRLLPWMLLWFACAAGAADGPSFRAQRVDGEFVVEGELSVAAPLHVAWGVITDYDRMTSFVPDMIESRVLSREDGVWRVFQRGVTRFGPLSFGYEVEREVVIEGGYVVRSHGVRGNLKKLEMTTRLVPDGAGTRILYHAVMVPDFWVPPLIGPRLMRAQAERQFAALVKEMERRVAAAGQ